LPAADRNFPVVLQWPLRNAAGRTTQCGTAAVPAHTPAGLHAARSVRIGWRHASRSRRLDAPFPLSATGSYRRHGITAVPVAEPLVSQPAERVSRIMLLMCKHSLIIGSCTVNRHVSTTAIYIKHHDGIRSTISFYVEFSL